MRRQQQSVGWITPGDVDKTNAYVAELRGKLAPLVAKCFATQQPILDEWAELSGRVDKQIANGSSWLYAPMQEMTGRVISKQLEAWKPRVAAAGCPIDAPPEPPTPAVPGWNLPAIAQDTGDLLARPLFVLLVAYWALNKLR